MKKQYKTTQLIGGFWNKYNELDYYIRALNSTPRKHISIYVHNYLMDHIFYAEIWSIQFETGRTINDTNEWEMLNIVNKKRNEKAI